MKNFILTTLLLFSFALHGYCQSTNIISYQDFEKIKFNSHTLKELMAVSDFEVFLEQNYGNPTDKTCLENPMTTYGCEITYNGFELVFDYKDVLFWIDITNGLHEVQIGANQFRVGSSIFELKSRFPKSYNSRYSIEDSDGKKKFIRVDISVERSETSILFEYDDGNNTISKIGIFTGGEQ